MTPLLSPSSGFFITGTDTEIGKTSITAGLTHAFQQLGRRVAPIKSLAAGQVQLADGRWVNDDVAQLHAAQKLGLTVDEVGPLQFREPCAPHIAARLEGRSIDRDALLAAIRATAGKADVTLVEGVGGFRVPITAQWDTADLAVDLGLPVVLVVGLRLGCINHALLTVEAVLARGLTLAGWVANTADPHQPHVADNLSALRARIDDAVGAPCWGHVPRLPDPSPAAVAAHLQQQALLNALKALKA
ncbi:dethiobiotin synthase [Roseateles amylovorans]|uniref:ATP-dependent dethiobiotin synthetase BioD n=1 Tax=Roseateles amylovorans TaxID=2978473 RepID=A0ABY6AXC2_9BURK|nr:dethiobiotin synthase [Roseateles amylovorans]UXH77834.1 dethiobiotin synthase [Roseateles amylovorans]